MYLTLNNKHINMYKMFIVKLKKIMSYVLVSKLKKLKIIEQ